MAEQQGQSGPTVTVSAEKIAEANAEVDANAPVKSANRIASLDFIRGIAVMGILLANIIAFGMSFPAYMYPEAFTTPHGETEGWMWVVQFVLIDGKMRGLFTVLFGAGMYLFMERAWAKGASRWLQARRLFWLFLFGVVHYFFIWRGDILTYYAIAGFIGLAFLRMSAKHQLAIGLTGFVFGSLLYSAIMTFPYLVAETDFGDQTEFADMREELETDKNAELADATIEQGIIADGSYADFVRHNFAEHYEEPLFGLLTFFFETLPLMLIGMGLYRYGFFNSDHDRGRMLKWGWIGILVGSALTVPIALWSMNAGFTYWGTLAAFIGVSPLPRLLVILGLAAVLAVWGARVGGWLAERISAAGRAAFTNYLGTSILMLFVFHGWAGGLHAELTRGQLYLVVLATWAVMLLWSKPWLERFRYGPLEWLWRCLTYWKLFPNRR